MNSNSENNCAKERWTLLRKAIIHKSIPSPREIPVSKRSFERFDQLLQWTPDHSTNDIVRIAISPKFTDKKLEVSVFFNDGAKNVDITRLNGFDRTGKLCIWPSEQILAFWCSRNLGFFKAKSVVEIGGGFHCFSGLLVSKFSEVNRVVLTDGDTENAQHIERNLLINHLNSRNVCAQVFRWDEPLSFQLDSSFDVVIAADVVYHDLSVSSLLQSVHYLLKPGGHFILFNPPRASMLTNFVDIAKNSGYFSEISVCENFDPVVSAVKTELVLSNPQFNPEWHYPYKVVFRKSENQANNHVAAKNRNAC